MNTSVKVAAIMKTLNPGTLAFGCLLFTAPYLHAQFGPAASNGTSASTFVSDQHRELINRVDQFTATSGMQFQITGKCVTRATADQGLNPLLLNPCRHFNLILKDRKGVQVSSVQTKPSGDFDFRVQLGQEYFVELKNSEYILDQGATGPYRGGDVLFLTLKPKGDSAGKQVSN